MRYFEKMSGERLYLSPINTDDVIPYTKWMNDSAVTDNLGGTSRNLGLDAEKRFLLKLAEGGHSYCIVLREGDTLIGSISLKDINHINRTATLGLFIGEEEHRNKGYGTEALHLILQYGFRTLNLHSISLGVHADNKPAIRCYQKCGFTQATRRREAVYKNGRYVDVITMDILDTELPSA